MNDPFTTRTLLFDASVDFIPFQQEPGATPFDIPGYRRPLLLKDTTGLMTFPRRAL